MGGQTYGLKPSRCPGWTPRIEVYGDDPTGLNFKLDSGGFSSTFRSTIELPDPKRVIFRGGYKFQFRGAYLETRDADIFGQLLTQNAMENVITAVGNTKEITYSVWDDGRLRSEVRTLGEIAEAPFVSRHYQLESRTFIEITSTLSCIEKNFRHRYHSHRSPENHPLSPVGRQGHNLNLYRRSSTPLRNRRHHHVLHLRVGTREQGESLLFLALRRKGQRGRALPRESWQSRPILPLYFQPL